MSSLTFKVTESEFTRAFEQFDVMPVNGVIDSAYIRPIDALRTLRMSDQPAFVFESESPEEGASRYSYVCASLKEIVRTGPNESSGDVNPISALRNQFQSRATAPIAGLPTLITGAFGFVAYEAVKHFEPSVGELPPDPTGSPVSVMVVPHELIVFDHVLDQIHVLIFENDSSSFSAAIERISSIFKTLDAIERTAEPQIENVSPLAPQPKFANYPEMVRSARDAIIDGELIQVVLGQRVEKETTADPIDIYEQLSTMNPSPYMYMLDLGDMQLIGASPELMLRSANGTASVHPIAGTRPRGETAEKDLQYEADLLSNEKESAEHVMLVDLARNDLGRVSKPGTVRVNSLKHIERYSHVMHLVSRVVGELSEDKDGIDAFESGFPIGTLSGAPKIRSIQLIAELEPEGRGPYCGGIGWFAPNGDVDTGTIIRSIVLHNGTAHVQGGAGIVFDSDPDAENRESIQKAKAPLLAISRAEMAAETIQDQHSQSNVQPSSDIHKPATIQLISD